MFEIHEIYNGRSGGAYHATRYLAHAIKPDATRCLGGVLVFSTEVNTEKLSEQVAGYELASWTTGHYLHGRYTSTVNGTRYDENSLSLELMGVDHEQLVKISMELCASLEQESVLLKDYSSGRVLLMVCHRNAN